MGIGFARWMVLLTLSVSKETILIYITMTNRQQLQMSDAIFLENRVGDVRFGRDFGRSAWPDRGDPERSEKLGASCNCSMRSP